MAAYGSHVKNYFWKASSIIVMLVAFSITLMFLRQLYYKMDLERVSGVLVGSSCDVSYMGDKLQMAIIDGEKEKHEFSIRGFSCDSFRPLNGQVGGYVELKMVGENAIVSALKVNDKVYIAEGTSWWLGLLVGGGLFLFLLDREFFFGD